MAHADLQHGNVILVPGRKDGALAIKLIDYDGMWVPALAGRDSGEVGHANYQHPQRLKEGTYSADVDRFPLLVVATALRGLMVAGRALWDQFDNGDNLLFKESDLRNPRVRAGLGAGAAERSRIAAAGGLPQPRRVQAARSDAAAGRDHACAWLGPCASGGDCRIQPGSHRRAGGSGGSCARTDWHLDEMGQITTTPDRGFPPAISATAEEPAAGFALPVGWPDLAQRDGKRKPGWRGRDYLLLALTSGMGLLGFLFLVISLLIRQGDSDPKKGQAGRAGAAAGASRPGLTTGRKSRMRTPWPLWEAQKRWPEITNSIGMKLVRIPAGKFTMGSPEGEEGSRRRREQHEVEITKEFWLGVHEVTQGQFKEVMGYNPSYFSKDGDG